MNTYGVILRGYTEFDYYQADSWRVEDGTVTLIKDGASVAVFPFENLLGIVDLTSGARLTEQHRSATSLVELPPGHCLKPRSMRVAGLRNRNHAPGCR
jgi:hypothetical protein